ncbi:hypothetical protein [Stieleria varia]|uniref:DUF1570 domain-containing protein n=1 Tax=Stieleria varia TaxID=2528005 RepID=A0A5C6B6B1_9BACT|nr:hypothetical protein [Stieleria varia]TWU07490.1 hypothetical protein Pla52n_00630 [Stieleria varia]
MTTHRIEIETRPPFQSLFRVYVTTFVLLVVSNNVNAQRLVGDGFVTASGQYVTITADFGTKDSLSDLAASFDAATGQWQAFWQLPAGSLDSFHVTAYIMRDKDAFRAARYLQPQLPDFPFGYAVGNTVWVVEQPGEYYTRHLLLHEGVHALSYEIFGGVGPSWFAEGTAELLSVHTGTGPKTQVNRVPLNRDTVPYWGRFKKMAERRDENKIPTLSTVLDFPADLNADVEAYSWSWAAAMLLSEYPQTADTLRAAAWQGNQIEEDFRHDLMRELKPIWPILAARWRLLCNTIDYGFDWQRERVPLSMKDPQWNGQPLNVRVAADQGWQSIGVRLPPGATVRLEPTGQCELAQQPKPWISQPPGVTIRYYRGRPLGQLLATLVPNVPEQGKTMEPFEVIAVEEPTTIVIKRHCWLMLRINDDVGELADNTGGYDVVVRRGG